MTLRSRWLPTSSRLIAGAVLAAAPTLAQAQGARLDATDGEPRIVATAVRTTRVSPDRAMLNFVVEANGDAPADATQRAATKLQAVVAALKQAGVTDANLHVIPMGVSTAQSPNSYPAPAQPAYVTRHAVRVQVARLEQVVPWTQAAVAAGGGGGLSPYFEFAAADSLRRARLSDAVAVAKADAEALAAALGGRLGALIEVATNGNPQQPGGPFEVYGFAGQIRPPDVIVSAGVTLRFRFVPR